MKSNPLDVAQGPGDTQPSAEPLDERKVQRWYGGSSAPLVVRDDISAFEHAARKSRPPPSVKILSPPASAPSSDRAVVTTSSSRLSLSFGWYVAGLLAVCLALSGFGLADKHPGTASPAGSSVSSVARAEELTHAARAARVRSDLPSALTLYTQASQLDPGSFAAAIGRADVEWDLGQQQRAEEHYRTLARTFPVKLLPARVSERVASTHRP